MGRPRRRFANEFEEARVFVGDKAIELSNKLSLTYPIDHGHIEDWVDVSN